MKIISVCQKKIYMIIIFNGSHLYFIIYSFLCFFLLKSFSFIISSSVCYPSHRSPKEIPTNCWLLHTIKNNILLTYIYAKYWTYWFIINKDEILNKAKKYPVEDQKCTCDIFWISTQIYRQQKKWQHVQESILCVTKNKIV